MECKYCGKEIPEGYTGKQCLKCYAEMEVELPYTAMANEGNADVRTEKKGAK